MLSQTKDCSRQLKMVVRIVIIYYGVVALVLVILPAVLFVVYLVLIRRGCVPIHRNAAPEGLIDQLPRIDYDPALFDDAVVHGYPSSCPLCLDAFDGQSPILCTRCTLRGHVFHKHCLRGWMQCARTCPLCRADLTSQTPSTADDQNP